MFKNLRFRTEILTVLAVGLILAVTNPSEEAHKKSYYKALQKNDSLSAKILHTASRGSDVIHHTFGIGSIFVYDNYLFFSVLKLNDDGKIDGDEFKVSIGALGIVWNIF
ncbi:MAG: hypothetical protein AB4372_11785 [Xenococcus sp. (in: cyanobacteria)]